VEISSIGVLIDGGKGGTKRKGGKAEHTPMLGDLIWKDSGGRKAVYKVVKYLGVKEYLKQAGNKSGGGWRRGGKEISGLPGKKIVGSPTVGALACLGLARRLWEKERVGENKRKLPNTEKFDQNGGVRGGKNQKLERIGGGEEKEKTSQKKTTGGGGEKKGEGGRKRKRWRESPFPRWR